MKKTGTFALLSFGIVLVAALFAAGCADNRTPAEKLMSYIEKNGGTGSAESSVSIDLPVLDGEASCALTLSKDALTLKYTAPDNDSTSATKSETVTTAETNLSNGSGKFLHESTLTITNSSLESVATGTFNAKSLIKGATPNVANVLVSNAGGSITGKATDGLKKKVTTGIDGGLESFSLYLEKSNLGLTLADFGFESY